jgi:ribosomal protein S27AE
VSAKPTMRVLAGVLRQSTTETTSLLRLFCPLCGEIALTEKDSGQLFRVSCGRCGGRAIVAISEQVERRSSE